MDAIRINVNGEPSRPTHQRGQATIRRAEVISILADGIFHCFLASAPRAARAARRDPPADR